MKEKLAIILIILGIIGITWGSFAYLGRYALGDDVKKVEQKIDGVQKQMDFKFKYLELKTIEDRIYDTEKRYGASPTSSEKKADLEKLKRDREQAIREMEEIKKK